MYASQTWGTRYMKEGAEMRCPQQTGHLSFLKRELGVKRTTCNWTVLRECGQKPLQSYWFRAVISIKCCNSMREVLQADRALSNIPGEKCWTSEWTWARGCVGAEVAPYKAPRYLNLELCRHVQQTISQFRLQTHTMGVEKACWQSGVIGHCDLCELQDLQDEKHALFLCNCASVCALRNKYAHLFFETSSQTRVSLDPTGFYEVSNEGVRHFGLGGL
eukprot:987164-Pelagomonas_calceolata.AAC.4